MLFYLSGLNAFLLLSLLVGTLVLYSMIGLNIVEKIFHERVKPREGVRFMTPFFTIIGALLALILAMVLVSIWQNYQKEKENVIEEVSNIANLYKVSKGLDEPERTQIELIIKQSLKDVIEDTWPRMAEGKEPLKATNSLAKLYQTISAIETKDAKHGVIKVAMIKNFNKAGDLRKNRNLKATQSMVPDAMWGVIIICIFVSLASGFFFRIRPFGIHVILTLLHAVMIAAVLFLIISLMFPYRGSTHITSEPFQKLLYEDIPFIDKHSK